MDKKQQVFEYLDQLNKGSRTTITIADLAEKFNITLTDAQVCILEWFGRETSKVKAA